MRERSGEAGSGEVERFGEHALGVGQIAVGRQRIAELAREDQDGAHGIVELAAEDLAPRQLERRGAARARAV